jgi:predicted DNA-binding protein
MEPRHDNLTFRINSTSKAKLKKLAAAHKRTVSQVVALIIDRYLDDLEKGKAPKLAEAE